MKAKRLVVFAITVLVAVFVVAGRAAAADAHSGTWKLNPAKSKYSPGPAQKSLTLKIEADENGIKVDGQGVNGDDSPLHVQYEAKFDGKDYPASGLPSGADTVSVKRVNANKIVTTQKKGGQVIMTVTSVVSKDGKTRTSTFDGKDAQGRTVHNVVVFDKE
jgi:hypothetical protein